MLLMTMGGGVLWLEGVQMRRFSTFFSYLHQTTKDLAESLDIPPDYWKQQQSQQQSRFNSTTSDIDSVKDSFSAISTLPPQQLEIPESFRSNVNVTEVMLKQVQDQYNVSTCVCPELMAAARFSAESLDMPIRYNISMMQLIGTYRLGSGRWLKDNSSQVRDEVFRSNQALLQRQGIDSVKALTRRPVLTTGMATPNFWKMEAMWEECQSGDRDLVWLLDADVVLMETVAIDVLWAYHAHATKQETGVDLDMLLAKDWRGVYTGSVIVNCKSPSAMQFLQEWKDEAIDNLALDWKGVPGHLYFIEPNMVHELNALRWLLNVPHWIRYPFRERRTDTKRLQYLRTRVRSTLTPCALATYHPTLYCEAKHDATPFEGPDKVNTPLWYEAGHQAVHVSSDIDRLRRNDALLDSIPQNLDHVVANVTTLKKSAIAYLTRHTNQPSKDPLGTLSVRECQLLAKEAKLKLRMFRKSIRGG
jgi:hypothetical protein